MIRRRGLSPDTWRYRNPASCLSWRVRATPWAVCVLVLTGCASAPSSITNALLPRIAIEPIRIEAQIVAGTQAGNREWVRDLLQQAAGIATGRAALDQRLASEVRLATRVEPADNTAYRLLGATRIPIALPPDLKGSHAFFRKGELVSIELTLVDSDGITLARAGSILDWHDVPWTTGPRRFRRARPQDAVLIDAISKGVQEAVRELVRDLRKTSTIGDTPSSRVAISRGPTIGHDRRWGGSS